MSSHGSLLTAICKSQFDHHVLAIDVSQLMQALIVSP